MDQQEKRNFLQQYGAAELEEKRLDREVERWKTRTARTGADYQLVRSAGEDNPELAQAVRQIANLTRDLIRQRSKLTALRQSIGAAIDSVSDDRLKELLRLRYIDGMTWEKIAEQMNYSCMQINRLHSKALSQINM